MSAHLRLLLLLACLLSACGGGGNTSVDTAPVASEPPASAPATPSQPPPAAPGHVYAGTVERNLTITSRITGITYPYHVYLPENYATSGKSYTVIYATDGQWTFPTFSLMLDVRRKAMILVNIAQGPQDRRLIDYLPGGALAYGRFLKEELVPQIESTYRTTGPRTFQGSSAGGVLGAVLLSHEDVATPFFKNYLLFDGAFWALLATNIQDEETRFAASPRLPVNLILTTANAPGNVDDVKAYEARYRSRPYEGMVIYRKDFNLAHNDVGDPSFVWALDLIE